eukprot:GEMP01038240.1.p1 GENE.GEMP01038240.1~~GEMP01038240.1.p1  ORF type:complete len:635 (+),score=174.32 GEMP01038240.1:28-1932(+)
MNVAKDISTLSRAITERYESVDEAFRGIALTEDEQLDFEQFEKCLKKLCGYTISDARMLFDEIDQDLSGAIDAREFKFTLEAPVEELRQREETFNRNVIEKTLSQIASKVAENKSIEEMFKKAGQTSAVSYAAFQKLLRELGVETQYSPILFEELATVASVRQTPDGSKRTTPISKDKNDREGKGADSRSPSRPLDGRDPHDRASTIDGKDAFHLDGQSKGMEKVPESTPAEMSPTRAHSADVWEKKVTMETFKRALASHLVKIEVRQIANHLFINYGSVREGFEEVSKVVRFLATDQVLNQEQFFRTLSRMGLEVEGRMLFTEFGLVTRGRQPQPGENLGLDWAEFREYVIAEDGAHRAACQQDIDAREAQSKRQRRSLVAAAIKASASHKRQELETALDEALDFKSEKRRSLDLSRWEPDLVISSLEQRSTEQMSQLSRIERAKSEAKKLPRLRRPSSSHLGTERMALDDKITVCPVRLLQAASTGVIPTLSKALTKYHVDARGPDNVTALMAGARAGRIEVLSVLLEVKANLDLTDTYGRTAMDHAMRRQSKECAEWLRSRGAHTSKELKERVAQLKRTIWQRQAEILRLNMEIESLPEMQKQALRRRSSDCIVPIGSGSAPGSPPMKSTG